MVRLYKIGIPPRGRTFDNTMARLTALGLVEPELGECIREPVREGKRLLREGSTREEVFRRYEALPESVRQHLMLYPNLARSDAPDRMQFRTMEIEIDGIRVLLVGMDHEHQPGALINGRIDVAVVGYDEMANTFAPHARRTVCMVRKWPAFNPMNQIVGIPVTIEGSMGLGDYTGHFLVSNSPDVFDSGNIAYPKGSLVVMHIPVGMRITGDEAYHQMYGLLTQWERVGFKNLAYPPEGTDIESFMGDEGGIGIVIVNTGESVRKGQLYVYKHPLQCSTTVVATKGERNGGELDAIVTALEPQSYDSIENLLGLYDWHQTLVRNMGEQWIGREEVTPASIFVDGHDRTHWAGSSLTAQEELLKILYESGRYLGATYAGYEHLRNTDLTGVSSTSAMLHNPDYQELARKASLELREFEAAIRNQHAHSPQFELSHVWYWSALAAAAYGATFDEIDPHKEIMFGYASTDVKRPEIDFRTRDATVRSMQRMMRYCGSICRRASVAPQDGFRLDFEEMLTRDYLVDAVETVYKAA